MNLALATGAEPQHRLWALDSLHDVLSLAAEQAENGIETINAVGERTFWRYADFYPQALAVSHALEDEGIQPGDRVLLRLADPADFVLALWGCLLLGAVAVPVAAGQPWPTPAHTLRLALASLELLRPTAMIGAGEDLLRFQQIQHDGPQARMLVVDAAQLRALPASHEVRSAGANGDDLALIFPTSGSTGQPKLVTQSARALIAMAAGSAQMNDFTAQDVFLNWMPMEHVGAVAFLGILPTCCGAAQIHLATSWVNEDLGRFPRLVAQRQATVGWVPNHVFSELAQREAASDWDFSSLRFLVNAGESISDQMSYCAERFSAHGLNPSALRPAFGMSETCSGLTWSSGDGRRINGYVDLGLPIPGASVRVTDCNGALLKEGETGNLQVRGPSVTQGYFNGEAENCFLPGGWFDTGDRAFLHQGRLYITDREGDGIDGISIPGYQLEAELERLPGVRAGYTAVCQSAGLIGIFFVAQSGCDRQTVRKRIDARLAQLIAAAPYQLFDCEAETIPRTSIGKIQRKVLRRRLAALTQQEQVE
ncbi:AMP-binding protein [Dickeya poaceiphila]|uniref:AMP-binding protein n=1 Tax=Dickeya poaceiphila TaxID=568768 RepID=A0A5B8ID65_9GAMM|nr:AMP-binding protein [Dickeya poaceiphila]QDX31418.1 AMP-binding protein [Dickeya poaceiphila]